MQTQAQVESAEAYEEARAAVKAAEAAVETAQAALCEAMLSLRCFPWQVMEGRGGSRYATPKSAV